MCMCVCGGGGGGGEVPEGVFYLGGGVVVGIFFVFYF